MALMNRLGNAHNRYQTPAKRVLAVCSAGLLRSPTVANVLHQDHGYNTRACGWCADFALIILDEVLIEWADEIVFVHADAYNGAKDTHKTALLGKNIVVLNLPDEHEWNSDKLKAAIREQYVEAVAFVFAE